MYRKPAKIEPMPKPKTQQSLNAEDESKFYELFLDSSKSLACGYWPAGGESSDTSFTQDESRPSSSDLDSAQRRRFEKIAEKLDMTDDQQQGLTVVDLGSGWGALSIYLARVHKAKVIGIDHNVHRVKFAKKAAAAQGLNENQVTERVVRTFFRICIPIFVQAHRIAFASHVSHLLCIFALSSTYLSLFHS
jgi:cyclopropane-fatty-acyl-phospholipid synthase